MGGNVSMVDGHIDDFEPKVTNCDIKDVIDLYRQIANLNGSVVVYRAYMQSICDFINKQQAEIDAKKKIIIAGDDLISQLQAENERLKKDLRACVKEVIRSHEIDRNKAIEDYKERLIFEIVNTPTKYQEGSLLYLSGVANRQNEIIDIINGLDEKEMVGEE